MLTFRAIGRLLSGWHALCRKRSMKLRKRLSGSWSRLKRTATEFKKISPITEASSLAYFSIFSIPGVIIITLLVASTVYDGEAVREALYTQAGGIIGEQTSKDLQGMVQKARVSEQGLFATIVGIVALVISATMAFASLHRSLNKIWRVEQKPGRGILSYLLSRATSLALIAALGFLLLISMVLDAALVRIATYTVGGSVERTWLFSALAFILSFGVFMLVFSLIFKFLPDARIPWRSVWSGSALTTAIFTLGKFLISLYIAKSGAADAYGASGAVIILMLWVFFSAIILLFGAQYAYTIAMEEGHSIEPGKYARFVEGRSPKPEEA